MLQPGTKIGRYEIRAPLGAGGMGEVYLAQDTRLDRKVALKILPDEVAADPDRMKRFEQEARAASGLNHPNIITIYEIDQIASTHFIAAEFIQGVTLRERMRTQLPLGGVLDVAVQIASALAAAHANGIVHRDIKPENVILRSDGVAKVLDFGVAKLTVQGSPESIDSAAPTRGGLQTDSGVVMGTACYMSPEQARGLQIDARSDIFSLGIVIYELLTGRLPFDGSSTYEIVASILSDREALPLSRWLTESPGELDRIVAKTLRKNREERYQTIKDLQLDLQSLRQQLEFERKREASGPSRLPSAAHLVTAAPPTRLTGGKQLVILALVMLVAGAIIYAWRWEEKSRVVSQPEIKSLAVLPLKSLDAGENYLGLGIADAAIRRISQTGKVIVRPTSAVRRYLNEDTDALTAAKQLGVDSVLEGSFQRADNRLRVSVNLLRSSDGISLWTDSFDLRIADIFAIQDTVSQQVASRLRLQLDPSQQARLTKQPTSNAIAYEFFLKGVYGFDQRVSSGKAEMETTIDFFKRAIQADPNFALAHAQLAYAYASMAVFNDPKQSWVDLANEEIHRAQELDPQLAETHLARFQLLYSEYEGYQGEAAVREVRLANQLNPNVGHGELAYLYTHLGLEDFAKRELELALEVDPTSDALKSTRLLIYEVGCNYDEYGTHRSVYHADMMEAWYFMGLGRFNEAQKAIDEWSAKRPTDMELSPKKVVFLALKGDFRAAEAEIPVILGQHPVKDPLYHHAAYDIGSVYALEGKSAEAVHWLRESAETGFHLYPRYQRDVHLDRIRQAPEFIQFLTEMKTQNERYQLEFGHSKTSGDRRRTPSTPGPHAS